MTAEVVINPFTVGLYFKIASQCVVFQQQTVDSLCVQTAALRGHSVTGVSVVRSDRRSSVSCEDDLLLVKKAVPLSYCYFASERLKFNLNFNSVYKKFILEYIFMIDIVYNSPDIQYSLFYIMFLLGKYLFTAFLRL